MQSAESSLLVTKRYERLGRLGAGAMGTVYRVRDRLTRAEVALKQVKVADDNADGGMWATQDDPRMALANEFQTLASLRHPHIISVLDYGFDERSRPYFTMTLLNEPQTLMEAAEDVPLTHQVKLLVQLLQALAYIHRRGIVHRDLKPSNVLVRDQQPVDFGMPLFRISVDG